MSDNIKHPDETAFGQVHSRRQTERKVRCIEIPEWGKDGEPLLLYAYVLTTGQVMRLEGKYATQTETNIMQMIDQCLDAKGQPYFSLLDKTSLMNEPGELIGRILAELNGEMSSFTEEIKKNTE